MRMKMKKILYILAKLVYSVITVSNKPKKGIIVWALQN